MIIAPNSQRSWSADSRILKRVQRMAMCQAVSTPPQFSSGNQACSASRAGIASQVRKVGDNSHCFSSFCFTVLLMLRCSTVSSNVGFVVSAQLMDLGIMYLWDISIVFGTFLPWKVKQRSLWIIYFIRSWWMIYLRYSFLFTKKEISR